MYLPFKSAELNVKHSYSQYTFLFFHLNIQYSLSFFQNDAKKKITEEEDNFTREVTEFNNEYGLTSNRDLLIKKKVKTEINDLDNEAALLKSEMESMEHKNVQLNALQLQKNELKQDLFALQIKLTVVTKAEKIVTQQHLSDLKIYLVLDRLKKELEKCKDDNWESVCETLQTEIEILQMVCHFHYRF
uniref:Coiled-coil domain-containing protein 172 n=1 Tax=Malurus cyaneus samueli TaxID=2593467 RepID=A0A8C5WZW3_9PASS